MGERGPESRGGSPGYGEGGLFEARGGSTSSATGDNNAYAVISAQRPTTEASEWTLEMEGAYDTPETAIRAFTNGYSDPDNRSYVVIGLQHDGPEMEIGDTLPVLSWQVLTYTDRTWELGRDEGPRTIQVAPLDENEEEIL